MTRADPVEESACLGQLDELIEVFSYCEVDCCIRWGCQPHSMTRQYLSAVEDMIRCFASVARADQSCFTMVEYLILLGGGGSPPWFECFFWLLFAGKLALAGHPRARAVRMLLSPVYRLVCCQECWYGLVPSALVWLRAMQLRPGSRGRLLERSKMACASQACGGRGKCV